MTNFKLYDWQEKCFDVIKGKDAIISSPTGSGKSLCAYLWAGLIDKEGNRLEFKNRVIFTAPIKALSNERYMTLKKMGFDVGIETGDYKYNADSKIICCTQEIYTLKYMKEQETKVIIDEFHYIFTEEERTRTYIDAVAQTHESSSLLIMSATFGDSEKLKKYLNKLSKRNFIISENEERITEITFLKKGLKPTEIKNAIIFVFSKRGIDGICNLIAEKRKKIDGKNRSLIYRMAEILEIENVPQSMRLGVGPYYGSMLPKEKLLVERAYRAKLIDIIVGTDALALGVNLPAETVVFGQLAKFKDGPISKNHFLQLSGRAGRKGHYDHGYVSYLNIGKNKWESRGYDTGNIFKILLGQNNESASVTISPKISDLLSEKTKPSEEAEYISEYSLPKKCKKEVTGSIMIQMKYLNSLIDKESNGNKAYKEKLKSILSITWDISLEFKDNIKLAKLFTNEEKINCFDVVDIFEEKEKNSLNGLLRAKCFINSLGFDQYVYGMEKIDEEIIEIDSSVFSFEEKNQKIDLLLEKNL